MLFSSLFIRLFIEAVAHRCSVQKGVLENLAKFTVKHLCWSLFLNKIAGLHPPILLEKRLQHMCVPVNFAKFLRTPFYRTAPAAASVFNSVFIRVEVLMLWQCKYPYLIPTIIPSYLKIRVNYKA